METNLRKFQGWEESLDSGPDLDAVALERENILLDEMLCMKYYAYIM